MRVLPVDKIKALSNALPKKDISIAMKFIALRDFESLKELVDSALFKVKKSQNSETPREEYKSISINTLEELKSEVDSYLILLGVPEEEVYEDSDFGEVIEELPSDLELF